MHRDLLPFPNTRARDVSRSDPGRDAMPALRRLMAHLPAAIEFARRVQKKQSAWPMPKLFFFHHPNAKSPQSFGDSPEAIAAARTHPDLALAWADLDRLVEDAFAKAAASAVARQIARAMPDLRTRLHALASVHPKCRQLLDLLSITDDEVIRVIIPHEGRGWRVLVRGLADLGQFQLLIADAVENNPPDPRLVDAYRFDAVDPNCAAATIRWQFYLPSALQPDGTLPAGFDGAEHWLWESQPLLAVPLVNGERLLYAGSPAYPRQWLVGRKFAAVAGELEVLETMTTAAALRRAA
jgi:hypothetical protein